MGTHYPAVLVATHVDPRQAREMDVAALLVDSFGRVSEGLHTSLEDLPPGWLERRAGPDANTIAWLVWHLVRVEDDHIAEVAGQPQRWTDAGWYDRFGLPFEPSAHGYGFTTEQVGQVSGISIDQLLGYADDVHEATVAFVSGLTADDLDRVVDERWDPPVTLGVRLVSVIGDELQHLGQVDLLRGLFERAG